MGDLRGKGYKGFTATVYVERQGVVLTRPARGDLQSGDKVRVEVRADSGVAYLGAVDRTERPLLAADVIAGATLEIEKGRSVAFPGAWQLSEPSVGETFIVLNCPKELGAAQLRVEMYEKGTLCQPATAQSVPSACPMHSKGRQATQNWR